MKARGGDGKRGREERGKEERGRGRGGECGETDEDLIETLCEGKVCGS